jgi:hypothetical protein
MATVTAAYPFIEVFIDNVEDPEMRKKHKTIAGRMA